MAIIKLIETHLMAAGDAGLDTRSQQLTALYEDADDDGKVLLDAACELLCGSSFTLLLALQAHADWEASADNEDDDMQFEDPDFD